MPAARAIAGLLVSKGVGEAAEGNHKTHVSGRACRPHLQALGMASYGLFSAPRRDDHVNSLEVLEAEALKLAPADRTHLLERLIASLDSDPEVEEAWELEADRREAALESGTVAEIPVQEAIDRLRARLAR
jgi:putative addiction module component (TIGR02574 family)